MKKALMVLALLGTFSFAVFAQDATKPDTTAAPDAATTTTKKTVKHSKKHHKVAKKSPKTTAPAESTPSAN